MTEVTTQEAEERKRAIFEAMSPRRRSRIERLGYEQWNPFEEPKDPIDIRRDRTRRTAQMLVREFLQTRTDDNYSNDYGRGVLEICLGIVNDEEKFRGMFEFSLWYRDLLRREGVADS